MARTEGAVNNWRKWDKYLSDTGQTPLTAVKGLIAKHMTWNNLLGELSMSKDISNRDFFIERASEVGLIFDAEAKIWTRIKNKENK